MSQNRKKNKLIHPYNKQFVLYGTIHFKYRSKSIDNFHKNNTFLCESYDILSINIEILDILHIACLFFQFYFYSNFLEVIICKRRYENVIQICILE